MNKRIGILSGTFDPVHGGHIAFAVQALHEADLDGVYFLPERRPRNKSSTEHYAHRVAMIKQAIKPHPTFKVLEFVETSFSVKQTLPKLRALFPGDELVLLVGSDLIPYLPKWQNAEKLIANSEIVVGLRGNKNKSDIGRHINTWSIQPKNLKIINCYAPHVSSTVVRSALRKRTYTTGILRSVERYSNKHWLYI